MRNLVDVVDVLDARRAPVKASDRAKLGGDVPYFGATGQAGTINRALFNEPLVLLGEDGAPFFDPTKQKAYLIDGPSWVNNHAHVLRPREVLDRRFLKYYLDVFNYRGFANGTTRLKLTQGAMRQIPIPVPELVDQLELVDVLEGHLSGLSAAESSLSDAASRLTSLRALALQERAIGPKFRLGDLAVERGYGTSTKCAVGGPGVPVARIPNLVLGHLDMSDEKRAADATLDLSALFVRRDDLLIVRTNGSRDLIGRTALIEKDEEVAFASYLIRYRLDASRIQPRWAQAVLGSPDLRIQLEAAAASSAGQYNLSIGKLDALEVPCPDIPDQIAALAWLENLDGGI